MIGISELKKNIKYPDKNSVGNFSKKIPLIRTANV
jgi:hypothetical protein